MPRTSLATVWLDGCSGCHMSLLDIDERLIALAGIVELVYSPLVDALEFPESVDVTLVEGGVSSDEDRKRLLLIRKCSRTLVSFGDCAVTANVPGMRNEFRVEEVLQRAFAENVSLRPQIPGDGLPRLLPEVRPLHEYVDIDVFLPGCPPPADAVFFLITELAQGRIPDLADKSRFGL